jgi:hypothetical protein
MRRSEAGSGSQRGIPLFEVRAVFGVFSPGGSPDRTATIRGAPDRRGQTPIRTRSAKQGSTSVPPAADGPFFGPGVFSLRVAPQVTSYEDVVFRLRSEIWRRTYFS